MLIIIKAITLNNCNCNIRLEKSKTTRRNFVPTIIILRIGKCFRGD